MKITEQTLNELKIRSQIHRSIQTDLIERNYHNLFSINTYQHPKNVKSNICCFYPIGNFYKNNINMAKLMADEINRFNKKIVLIGCGSSGALLSAWISIFSTNISRIIIFNKRESNHRQRPNPLLKNEIPIIIDDFISTGETLKFLLNKCCFKLNSYPEIIMLGNIDLNTFQKIEKINQLYDYKINQIYGNYLLT